MGARETAGSSFASKDASIIDGMREVESSFQITWNPCVYRTFERNDPNMGRLAHKAERYFRQHAAPDMLITPAVRLHVEPDGLARIQVPQNGV